jgi:threonine dehydrogenase-like Zn-dependent dehydrogenase
LAIQACHTWGRTVFLGETGHVNLNVSDDLLHKQRTIYGSWVTSVHNMDECCDDLVAWNAHPDRIVTDAFPLANAPDAYALMATGKCGKVVIEPES